MIRFLGSALLLLGGAWLARLLLQQQQRQLETLGELLYALRRMETEIRWGQEPLLVLAARMARDCRGAAADFFQTLLRLCRAEPERPLAALWRAAAAPLPLPPEAAALWGDLGRRLVGDGESVRAAVLLTAEELETLRAALEADRPRRKKLTASLCLTAAAFAVILLL